MRLLTFKILAVTATIIGGTGTTLFKSYLVKCKSANSSGITEKFAHPYFVTLLMFLSETLTLLILKGVRAYLSSPDMAVAKPSTPVMYPVERNSGLVSPLLPPDEVYNATNPSPASSEESHTEGVLFHEDEVEEALIDELQEKPYYDVEGANDDMDSSNCMVEHGDAAAVETHNLSADMSALHFLTMDGDVTSHLSGQSASLIIEPKRRAPWAVFFVMAVLDLGGTSTGAMGLMYGVAPSIYQVLKGASTLFTAMISIFFLRRRFYAYHWAGLLLLTLGLTLAGLVSQIKKDVDGGESEEDVAESERSTDTANSTLGLLLTLLGQLFHAFQGVFEERYLKSYRCAPMEVVGKTGAMGLFLVTCVAIPVSYLIPVDDGAGGTKPYDNPWDALVQLYNSPQAASFALAYLVSIAVSNIAGLSVTKVSSAVHRTIVNCSKTILIWMVGVLLFYCINQALGEALSIWSLAELGGFMLFILGTLFYNGLLNNAFPSCAPLVRE